MHGHFTFLQFCYTLAEYELIFCYVQSVCMIFNYGYTEDISSRPWQIMPAHNGDHN